MKSILFVCTGNICRSPMAEALLRHMLEKAGIAGVEVFSRGVSASAGTPMTEEAVQALAAVGVEAGAHRAMPLTLADLKRADLVLGMEEMHRQVIQARFPDAAANVSLLREFAGDVDDGRLDIPDPFGGSPEEYEKCRMDIQDSLLSLLSKLKFTSRHPDESRGPEH